MYTYMIDVHAYAYARACANAYVSVRVYANEFVHAYVYAYVLNVVYALTREACYIYTPPPATERHR